MNTFRTKQVGACSVQIVVRQ